MGLTFIPAMSASRLGLIQALNGCPLLRCRSTRTLCVFEQLNDIPRWVLEQDLSSRSSLGHVTAETCSRFTQFVDHSIEIICHDHEPAPPTWLRIPPGFPGTASSGRIEEKVQILKRHFSELSRIVLLDLKAETVTVKIHGFVDIVCNVPNRCHAGFSSGQSRDSTRNLRSRPLHDAG
jgi:hypothetical protein